jgi:hypothetical protein
MSNDGLAFQRYAFNSDSTKKRGYEELRRLVGGELIGGFQIKNIRRQEREVPPWASTNEGIRKVLLTAFPKLHFDKNHRKRAGRWAQVIQMHFLIGWTYTEVAAELNITLETIKSLIRSVNRASKGLRANGSGTRTGGI